jgi:hypothetical protein
MRISRAILIILLSISSYGCSDTFHDLEGYADVLVGIPTECQRCGKYYNPKLDACPYCGYEE